ncbi:MAG: glycosyltransferase [Bacteroidales bacterium]
MKKEPTILLCPLDWGIGHATRCVPIIHALVNQGAKVIVATDNRPFSFLQQEFPHLQFVRFPGYNFSYPEKGSMVLKMLFAAPGIIRDIKKEHLQLDKMITDHNIDAVISDNRFGLYSKLVPSVYITHQVMIKAPAGLKFLEPMLHSINKKYISKYSTCWIPDFAGETNLSGDLSHKYELQTDSFFIGPLSRFYHADSTISMDNRNDYDFTVMLSGPEPQRTILEQVLIAQLKKTKYRGVVLGGKPDQEEEMELSDRIRFYSHLDTASLKKLLQVSDIVISRPGYSTIMDLAVFGKKAIFIPTPGQTEQEYLAEYFRQRNMCFKMEQNDLNISKAMEEVKSCQPLKMEFSHEMLKAGIESLLSRI